MHNIGIFDSGLGGLTVMKDIIEVLPRYNYVYLGDNARAPYGTRSFETVFEYTWEGVKWLFNHQNCNLIIIACNTASAKALRTIQQKYLDKHFPGKRVLGVIRPTTEIIGQYTQTQKIGIMATNGTVNSKSYPIEIARYFPSVEVFQQACPLLVPLIENNEHFSEGADYFIEKYCNQLLQQHTQIDTVLLACTHYPIIKKAIEKHFTEKIKVIGQGKLVAESLKEYLQRHTEIEMQIGKESARHFFTTDDPLSFDAKASVFFGEKITAAFADISHE